MLKLSCLFLLPFVFATQAHASAFDSLNDQKLQEQAMKILARNASAIDVLGEVSGDVHADEKLVTTLKEIESHNEELLNKLAEGGDIENLESRIMQIDTKCKKQEGETSANCDLLITYRPLGEKNVNFKVFLDKTGDVIAIDKKVVISRGD